MMGILLKGQPDNVEALVLRGRSYFYMDDQSMAKRHFGEALKHDPDHKQAKAEFSKVRGLYKKKAQVSLLNVHYVSLRPIKGAGEVIRDHTK